MSPLLLKLRTWWEDSDRSQKTITLGGMALLVFLLVGTFYFATRPKYALLFSGMNEADKNTVVTEIQAMGIPVKYDVAGQVEIPQDKIGEVNMKLAGGGKLPKSAHPGIPDLDKMSLFSTPAQEKERLKVILEGELAKSIESLESVQAARVHITLGDNSPFVQERSAPTASVSITEAAGTSLSGDQGRAIAALVANACEGMTLANVTVMNQRMEIRFDGSTLNSDKTAPADKLEMENRVAAQRKQELQQALDMAFGPGSTVVRVTCEIDLDKQRSSVRDQKPSEDPVTTTKTSETMVGDNVTARSPAGTVSNTPSAPEEVNPDSSKSNYNNRTVNEQRAVTETTTETEKATGGVKSMVINVLANTDKIPDLTALERYLQGEVKNRAQDTINFPAPTVVGVKFDTSTADAAARAQAEVAGQARMQQFMSLVPVIALLVVAFMVVRQVGKFAGASAPGETALVVADGHPEGPYPISGDETPMLPGEHTPMDETDGLLAALRANAEDGQLSSLDAPEIKDKVDLPLESLRRMADDRPQLVGQLIKSMLLEERK
jgi:flagellar M-ring protein FliF